jgi:hypothetical protein
MKKGLMAKKLGSKATNIFAATTPKADQKGKGPGRPKRQFEEMHKVQIMMPESLMFQIDDLTSAIRRNTGQLIQRSSVSRAMFTALLKSESLVEKLVHVATEEDIVATITKALK